MGCDIHTHIEYKRTIGETKWVCGDYFRINPYYHDDEEPKYYTIQFCENRDYTLFATLADVRNYGETPYISQPKGIPYNVTEEVKEDFDSWGMDAHSASYFTLKELIDFFNENPNAKHSGMISPEAAKQLDETGKSPDLRCRWTNKTDWVKREWQTKNDSLEHLIESIKTRADELSVIYRSLWDFRPDEAYQKAENIRIVFWFDN